MLPINRKVASKNDVVDGEFRGSQIHQLTLSAVIVLVLLGALTAIGFHLNHNRLDAEKHAMDALEVVVARVELAAREAALQQDASRRSSSLNSSVDAELHRASCSEDRLCLILDQAGQLKASLSEVSIGSDSPVGSFLAGKQLRELIRSPGVVMPIKVDGAAAYAALSPAIFGEDQLLVIETATSVFTSWWRSAWLHLAIFSAFAIPLLFVLGSFYRQRSRADQANARSNLIHRRMETALSRGLCGLWDWDLKDGTVHWSRSMYELLGYPPSTQMLSINDVTELVHTDDIDLFEIANQAAAGRIERVDELFRMRHANGSYVWVRIRTEVVEGANNQIHMIGIAADVTENHRLARENAAASQRLKAAIETTAASFALWDAKDRLVMANSRFADFHGLHPRDALPGTPREEIKALIKPPIMEKEVGTSDLSGSGCRTVERLLHDERWIQVSERSTKDGGTISVGTDITLIKNHEQMHLSNEQLLMATVEELQAERRLSQEKTQKLEDANHRLEEATDRAKRAYEAKSAFLANMSHELRTPLNAILGFSDIMKRGVFGPVGNEKYSAYAHDIFTSGSHLMEMVNDILEMSKIEAGRVVLESEDMDLQPIIAEAVQMLSVEAAENEIEFDYQIPEELRIFADRRALRQTLINLISNAVKFTDAGGKVTVYARCLHSSVEIEIEDTGCGIPTNALTKIGKPFEQVQGHLARNHKGTGLGLAIAKSLTELHSGTLEVESTEGVGTRVLVTLPQQHGNCCEQRDSADIADVIADLEVRQNSENGLLA
ncbi:MAG: ATP-binding protein [Pseudomonadota bacterium]